MHIDYTPKDIARFWSKIDKTSSPNGCWLWTGYCNHGRYGAFTIKLQHMAAHRFSWELHNGPIPDELLVCHKCDVPACCNPGHLFLGTQTENMADRDAKHRQATGAKCGAARLTAAQVSEIRELYDQGFRRKALAAHFGIGLKTLIRIVTYKSWPDPPVD